jgi:hypothetical protein
MIMLLMGTARAEIVPISSIREVAAYSDSDVELAIFDVDMVLIQPADPSFQMANMQMYSRWIKGIWPTLDETVRQKSLNLMNIRSESILIETDAPHLLSTIQSRSPTMALTANFTGSFAGIEDVPAWKMERLAQFEIDFQQHAPFESPLVFEELPAFRGNQCAYLKGMLFVNGYAVDKGAVLVAFLKKTGLRPRTILFVDDRMSNLEAVEKALRELDPTIRFLGLHYVGNLAFPAQPVTEDQFVARWTEVIELAKELP